jgi:hypothetical protein
VLRYLTDRTLIGDDESCWPWLLSTGSHGYGQGWDGVTVRTAHSMWWEAMYGPVPKGLTIDHICHNRVCQNVAHMRLLTNRENGKDNGFATRTHCPSGHEYTPGNTRYQLKVRPGRRPYRKCKTCQQARNDTRRTS